VVPAQQDVCYWLPEWRCSVCSQSLAYLGHHHPIIISRLNPSQSNAATDAASSRNTTITLCEVVKFRERSGKARFEEKNAAINLQPNTVAERTQESPKEATLSTCGRGCECCVVRSLDKRVTKRHFNGLRGPPVYTAPELCTNKGIFLTSAVHGF
jgi:hypothetical protein